MEKEKPFREKLLAAASEAFVRKGFHRATIAGICERVKANITAVNYYFETRETTDRKSKMKGSRPSDYRLAD